MKKLALTVVAAITMISFAGAEESLGEKAAEFREGNMSVISWNMGILGTMAKGAIPYDKLAAEKAAKHLLNSSELVKDGYIDGSYEKSGAKVKSVAAKKAEFDKYADKLTEEAKLLVAAAGDEAKFKAQIGAVGKTCHDQFKD